MSELDNNTSDLDEAQKDEPTQREEYLTNVKNFISSTFSSGFRLIFWFIISLFVIYACKLSQANVLPTDINCFPYSYEKHFPKEIQTNIFTNSSFSKPRKSMKMSFDVEGSDFVNGMLKFFRDYKVDNDSSFLGNFFYSIIESMFMKNYSYYSYILTFVDVLPEFLLVFFGPYLGLLVLVIGILLNAIYFVWYWFSNLGWMWKKNGSIFINERGEVKYTGPPRWIDVRWTPVEKTADGKTDWSKSEWGKVLIGLVLIIIFAQLFFALAAAGGVLIVPIIFNVFVLYTFLTYNMKLGETDAAFTDLFEYFFRYNKLLIMSAFTIYVVVNANTYLGPTSAGFAILTMFLIYYLRIIEMFAPVGVEDERTSPLASTRQAKKEACEKPIPKYDDAPEYVPTPAASEPSSSTSEETAPKDKKSFSLFGSKDKTEGEGKPPIEYTPAGAPPPPDAPAKKGFFSFGSKDKTPEAPVGAGAEAGAVAPLVEGAEAVAPLVEGAEAVAPLVEGAEAVAPTQGGGYKYKQIGGENLIRELKKFNKKYASLLV